MNHNYEYVKHEVDELIHDQVVKEVDKLIDKLEEEKKSDIKNDDYTNDYIMKHYPPKLLFKILDYNIYFTRIPLLK